MSSRGNTGDLGWKPEKVAKYHDKKMTGKCDAGCGKPAVHWFGMTSCGVCNDQACLDKLQADFDKDD